MKVICPKCQFENQADSSRVVCGRCATIIQVKLDQGTASGEGTTKRQTARLPFANGNGNSGPLSYPSGPSGPLTAPSRDVYATRLGEEFDNVLDLPGPTPTNYQTSVESAPVFDDVFATPPSAPSYDSNTNYNFSAYDKRPTMPVENMPGATASQRVTQDYAATPDPEFMGWPMLPENSLEDDDDGGNYTAQRGGVLARVALIVLAFGVLSFLAYYFLWDYIAKRKDQLAGSGVERVEERPSQPSGNVDRANKSTAAGLPKTVATPTVITPKLSESIAPPNANMREIAPAPPELKGPDGHSRTAKPVPQPTPMAPVIAAAAPPTSNTPKVRSQTPNRGNLTIQVGSFSDRVQAESRAAALQGSGAEARVVAANIPGKGTWYRVQVGGFESREAANGYAGQLRAQGRIQDFIVTSK